MAKQRAGASACILNHSGDVDALTAPPVPMVADRHAALRLASFPGSRLPTGFLAEIATSDAPSERGVELAAALAASLVRSGRFAGINLSGGAAGTTPHERLEATASFIAATRAALAEG